MAVVNEEALPPVKLALAENAKDTFWTADWIGPLVALGAMVARAKTELAGRQLIVVVSVPRRDFAAALVGCGWVLWQRPPILEAPLDQFRTLLPQAAIRVVTDDYVLTDRFVSLENPSSYRVHLQRSQWFLSTIRATAAIEGFCDAQRSRRPRLGSLGKWAGLKQTWSERLAASRCNLALIGTLAWLRKDLDAMVGVVGQSLEADTARESETKMSELILPFDPKEPVAFSRLYSSAGLGDELPLPRECEAVILDGTGAVKYVSEIEAPFVTCILDRSVGDETAAEILIQLRNSRGRPVSLWSDLGWRPPLGIEAFAFTLPL